jgi:predicted membrane metal-binding protein
MQHIRNWLPALFCAFLSVLALWLWAASGTDRWTPVFFAFLPMCFLFSGMATSSMNRQILDLQKELADLRAQHSG